LKKAPLDIKLRGAAGTEERKTSNGGGGKRRRKICWIKKKQQAIPQAETISFLSVREKKKPLLREKKEKK